MVDSRGMGSYLKGSQHTVVENKGKHIERLRTIYTHTFHLCFKLEKPSDSLFGELSQVG